MKFPVLVSYAYARKKLDAFIAIADDPKVDILLDSGAFTAKNSGEEIKLDDYCRFLDDHKHRIFRYLALDVVGDPIATDDNLHQMLKAGYKPVPVHVLGDDERRMDELFELSDFVACAGLRRPNKGGAPKEYVQAKMKWARGRKVHWLGYVIESMIQTFKPYSCDCASWASSMIYGNLSLYLGNGRWINSGYDSRSQLLQSSEAMRLLRGLGFTVKQINDKSYWRSGIANGLSYQQFLTMVVAADSWVRYAIDIEKRFGTRLFIATAFPGGHENLNMAIERHSSKLKLELIKVSK